MRIIIENKDYNLLLNNLIVSKLNRYLLHCFGLVRFFRPKVTKLAGLLVCE